MDDTYVWFECAGCAIMTLRFEKDAIYIRHLLRERLYYFFSFFPCNTKNIYLLLSE